MPFLEFDRITKGFPGVQALDGVSFAVAEGTCHALVGENGAGKSTLGKILAGVHAADSGVLRLEGQVIEPATPLEARRLGIAMLDGSLDDPDEIGEPKDGQHRQKEHRPVDGPREKAGAQPSPEMIEIAACRLLVTYALRPLATGQTMTEKAFDDLVAEIKQHKVRVAKERLEEYTARLATRRG